MKRDETPIPHLLNAIVTLVHPLRIILFSSTARNEMNINSDLDVLVIMPDGSHRRKTAQLLYRQITGLGVPFDILVATPTDLQYFGTNKGLIYETILRDGVEVYTT